MSQITDLLGCVPADELRRCLIRLTIHAPADTDPEAIEALHELIRLAELAVQEEHDQFVRERMGTEPYPPSASDKADA